MMGAWLEVVRSKVDLRYEARADHLVLILRDRVIDDRGVRTELARDVSRISWERRGSPQPGPLMAIEVEHASKKTADELRALDLPSSAHWLIDAFALWKLNR